MAHLDDDNEDFLAERNVLVAYMMSFAIKSYKTIQNRDSEALYDLCTHSAEEIYAYRNGKTLPSDPGTGRKPKNHGWRVL